MKKRLIAIAFLLSFSLLIGCEPKENGKTTGAVPTSESPAVPSQENCSENDEPKVTFAPEKPVIYLYPQSRTEVEVRLDFNGRLTCTYPHYNGVWRVTAETDGTLINHEDGREYSYLYWEGVTDVQFDMSRGFVVKGEETAAFLQEILPEIGLTPREYNEFIVYWLPQMQNNAYNLITFQTELYTENAKLTVTPSPDSMLRVFMVYQALEAPIEIEEPVIEPFVREGFCVVEWGGAEYK